MKAPTVFLGELTNSELESWLEKSSTVIIPVGAVEQHGPHSAMSTDAIIFSICFLRRAHSAKTTCS
jgi:creatinine amidohydrolase